LAIVPEEFLFFYLFIYFGFFGFDVKKSMERMLKSLNRLIN